MKFRTAYDRVRVESFTGFPVQPTYKIDYDKKGVRQLVKSGSESLYMYIQSHFESCDLHTIMDKFQQTNNPTYLESILNKNTNGIYFDASSAPSNLAEAYAAINDASTFFSTLPLDVRKEFNFSLPEFLASVGTDKFNDIFSNNRAAVSEVIPTDVVQPVVDKVSPVVDSMEA